ncbi:hypothetical protein NLX62_05485, partial [Mycobacteriaceae bacterium Msp059]|nr:hypothetical protein [Mycobacteriaceae bacterium Msp059]
DPDARGAERGRRIEDTADTEHRPRVPVPSRVAARIRVRCIERIGARACVCDVRSVAREGEEGRCLTYV